MDEYNERAMQTAEAGAALLDKKIPNWVELIDLSSLEMSEPCSCIIGQIGEGKYNLDKGIGFNALAYQLTGVDGFDQLVDHGFEADDWVDYDDLEEAWTKLILARRAAA
jgi:hypothetical protein